MLTCERGYLIFYLHLNLIKYNDISGFFVIIHNVNYYIKKTNMISSC